MCIICAIYSVDNKLKDEPKPKKKTQQQQKNLTQWKSQFYHLLDL